MMHPAACGPDRHVLRAPPGPVPDARVLPAPSPGVRETPAEFDSEIMAMLKDFIKNKDRESRIAQPDLYEKVEEKAQ